MLGTLAEVVYANRDHMLDLLSVGVGINAHPVVPGKNAHVPRSLGSPPKLGPKQGHARQQQAQNGQY